MNDCLLLFWIYLIDLPKVDAIRNRPRVLQSGRNGEKTTAKVTVNYYTASQDASDTYIKVKDIFKRPRAKFYFNIFLVYILSTIKSGYFHFIL